MSSATGILYVVATPIGHLEDITLRALDVLRQVDLIAAEDTRHCRTLLTRYDISTATTSLHQHNERAKTPALLNHLRQGRTLALVSDAGTPLISDPGYPLISAALAESIRVIPIPGPCAAITALSAAGLPTDRFAFEGFPPRQAAARRRFFETLRDEPRTLVFYESSHRIEACLQDLAATFPPKRRLVLAKELTKVHESLISSRIQEAPAILERSADLKKGEFVLIVEGAPPPKGDEVSPEHRRILHLLLAECSLKTAVSLAEKITGARKKPLYAEALHWQERNS